MRAVHSVLIAAALAAAVPAFAQQTRIEDRLTDAEFRAAGLEKLSDAELARLNELLARGTSQAAPVASPDVEARIAQAREEGRREAAVASDQGVRPAESREPVESTIPGAFAGFARGREYTLANGQVWKQTDNASIAGARGQNIGVRVRPGLLSAWWLQVDGYNAQAKVERVR
ncbi:hypothetical protein LU699_04390 [Luteimonas fraxinea]|jgi:hypothetical protein|uniref:Secreted protein n=1 Tax=Luteimonas fraxinea TaxID=2901869 RepID=A0ABS8U8F5_9GAMM|nr:hypothetical protein [Luteimonas fraxinea]MCD9095847.1 hypothetical protein [Luteimonas fraxinea]MCD9124436.1 hypothetical protein [Luteimonas fraxinea]UHH10974.1 hypothetical protein LU699_04390 [Luteimonas fraxinea]